MAAPIRRRAINIKWAAPSGKACSLSPMSGGQGLLEIEVIEGIVVVIHSRNCLLVEGQGDEEDFTEVAEFEATVPLQRCQITWSFTERTEDTVVERSAYFAQ